MPRALPILAALLSACVVAPHPARAAGVEATTAAAERALAWVDLSAELAAVDPGSRALRVVAPGVEPQLLAALEDGTVLRSVDGGGSWQVASHGSRLAAPTQLVCDPRDGRSFWVAGGRRTGLSATSDGGATFRPLGLSEDVDAVAVDFADPKRATILACLHGQERGLMRSSFGGGAWSRIGAGLPEKSTAVAALALDKNTYLVSCVGAKRAGEGGIYRSADGGRAWTQVGAAAARGPALTLGDGSILWPSNGDDGLLKSDRLGGAWRLLPGPARRAPTLLPNGWIAALGDSRLVISTDQGESWDTLGPELPARADGLAYLPAARRFVAWRGGLPAAGAVAVLDLPEDPSRLLTPAIRRDILAWDGDTRSVGAGWMNPPGGAKDIAPQGEVARRGGSALRIHAASGYVECGWNLFAYDPAEPGFDVSAEKSLVMAVKCVGPVKPAVLRARINSPGAEKKFGPLVDLLPLCPAALDGGWHEILVPLKALGASPDVDLRRITEVDFTLWVQGTLDCDLYVDDIGFCAAE